jgi:CHAT domain-containing protein
MDKEELRIMMRVRMIKIASLIVSAISLVVVTTPAIGQQKFEFNTASTRRALERGEIAAALAFYEASAVEAEKNAEISRSPEQYWEAARIAYKEASRAAKFSGQAQKMLTYGDKSLSMARRIDKPGRILSGLNDVIAAHKYVKNFRRVDQYLEEGFTIVRSLPAQTSSRYFWDGILYGHLGDQDERRRDYDAAVKSFSLSVGHLGNYVSSIRGNSSPNQLRREVGRGSLLLRLTKLGESYRKADRLHEALDQYQRAFKLIGDWRFRYFGEGDLHYHVGTIHVRLNQIPEALDSFNKALALAENQQRPSQISRASTAIGNVLRQSGRADDAIVHYRRSIDHTESTRSLLQSEEFRQSFFEGGLGVYVSVIDSFLKAEKQEDAFNYSERARSRVFLDVLGSKVQLGRQADLADDERKLQARITMLRARATDASVDEELENSDEPINPAQRSKELAVAEKTYTDFLAKVRKENKEQASLMNVEPLTLKEIQERLDPGVALLEYFIINDAVIVWVVEKDRVSSERIPIRRKQLQAKVTSFRESINQLGELPKLNQQARELFKLLLEPALVHVKSKELVIVPHDVLHYLPFQALLSSQGKYLIEDYPINYLSSASLMQFTQEKRKAKGELSSVLAQGGKVLTFGNPDLNDPKKTLQYAGIEAKQIKSLYPQSTIYLEKEATEERAKSLSSQNDIIHFASHAELSEDDPLASAILLARSDKEDGRLEVREIFGMDLKASLVVLSACETGLGKLSSGDELVGLTRAFIYAGTPSVVASLWNVEDSSTAQLMASFYKNLKTMTKVEALRQAQLQLIQGKTNSELLARRGIGGVGKLGEAAQPKPDSSLSSSVSNSIFVSTSHPYFWAPFILVGEGK